MHVAEDDKEVGCVDGDVRDNEVGELKGCGRGRHSSSGEELRN